jgi:putative FmdB family regulatory protein
MPLYEFECIDHGVFELERGMAHASERAVCHVCQREAPRIMSLPNLAQVPRSQAIARERNEKSQHEPRLVTR